MLHVRLHNDCICGTIGISREREYSIRILIREKDERLRSKTDFMLTELKFKVESVFANEMQLIVL